MNAYITCFPFFLGQCNSLACCSGTNFWTNRQIYKLYNIYSICRNILQHCCLMLFRTHFQHNISILCLKCFSMICHKAYFGKCHFLALFWTFVKVNFFFKIGNFFSQMNSICFRLQFDSSNFFLNILYFGSNLRFCNKNLQISRFCDTREWL